jgi:hypothetical protein
MASWTPSIPIARYTVMSNGLLGYLLSVNQFLFDDRRLPWLELCLGSALCTQVSNNDRYLLRLLDNTSIFLIWTAQTTHTHTFPFQCYRNFFLSQNHSGWVRTATRFWTRPYNVSLTIHYVEMRIWRCMNIATHFTVDPITITLGHRASSLELKLLQGTLRHHHKWSGISRIPWSLRRWVPRYQGTVD